MQIALGMFLLVMAVVFAVAFLIGYWTGKLSGALYAHKLLDSMGCAEEMLAKLHPEEDCPVIHCPICTRICSWRSVMEAP